MTAAYDPTTALLVVDVQNDFADPEGSLYVAGGEEVVLLANAEVDAARRAGAVVVFTQDWHPPATPHFASSGGVWPDHCVRDTWGADLHPGLVVPEGADVVRKGTGGEDGYSGFTVRHPTSGDTAPTGLDDLLRERDVAKVVVCGLATDYCVRDTAVDAARLGYDTTVLAAAARAVDLSPGDGEAALAAMADAGAKVERA